MSSASGVNSIPLQDGRARVALFAIAIIAGASAQGCELRPSRQFAPPANVSAGPPIRTFTAVDAADAGSAPDEEPPGPSKLESSESARDQVVVRRLKNGMMLHARVQSDLPTATVLVVFGRAATPTPLATAWVYAGAALRGRAFEWSRHQLDGAHVVSIAKSDYVAFGMTALSPVIEPVLSRVLPLMVEAKLWDTDVVAAKEDLIGGLGRFDPERRARATALAGLFPAPHPYGLAGAAALPDRIREVKLAEVRAFRDANLAAENMMVAAAGNLDVDALVVTLDRALAAVPRTRMAHVPLPTPQPACAGQVIALDDAGAQQTTVNLAYPGVAASSADLAALEVLAAAAGGSISTHLNATLRRGRGLTYGFASELEEMRDGGVFTVRGAVDSAHVVDALRALNDELDALRANSLDDVGLRGAKIRAAHAISRLGGAVTAVRLAHSSILGVPMSQPARIEAVTAAQVRDAAERYLQPAKRCIVVVGDAARLDREMRGAGFGPVLPAP